MKKIRRQIILAISMVFLVLAVCSAAAAAEVSDNSTIQAQDQTTSHKLANINAVQASTTNTNSSQSSTTNADSKQTDAASSGSVNTNTTDQPSKFVISGQVKKCSNGEPFPGVTVTAEKDGTELASTTTDANGNYTLEFLSDGGVFNVTASYPGHKPSTKAVTVTADSNGTLQGTADFQLGPETFVDDNWVGLPAGTIVFFPGDPNPHVIGVDAFATISDGVTNTDSGGTLHIADGLYQGAANKNILITKDLTIIGQSQAGTIIDAQSTGGIFSIFPGSTVTISNLTLTNGNSPSAGGAIINNGDLTINDCTFTNNHATTNGGAIYNSGIGTLTVDGSTFTSNSASNGGAIFNDDGTLTVNDCTFTGNTVTTNGGAINNDSTGTLTVDGSTFTGNTATNGGAILNQGDLTITGSNFESNIASGNGGAIFNIGGDASNRNVHFNRIVGNSPANSEVFSLLGTLDATLNWWGSNSSPAGKISTAGGGVVLFDPWLVLSITSNPSTIFNGGTSQVTADLLHDSNGVFHDPALGHVPDGIPVTLTILTWGSFTNPGNTDVIILGTVNGSVTATYFANEGPTPQPPLNPVEITATVDDETVSTFITILTPPSVITIGAGTSILSPSQSQTQNQAQAQAQTSINTNTNNLTNTNANRADSTSFAANINNITNANIFNPVIILGNLNSV